MKNIFFALFSILMLSGVCAKASYTVTKSGGGSNGYDKVVEDCGDGWKTLDCKSPGNSDCKWSSRTVVTSPTQQYDFDADLTPYVDGEIAHGTTRGSLSLGGGIVLTWSGTDAQNCTISVTP